MSNTDFDIFTQEIEWFAEPADKIDVTESTLLFSDAFASTFPTLHKLVAQASVSNVTVTRKKNVAHYKLFTWTNNDDIKSGWLCKIDTAGTGIELLPQHQLLVSTIGGIEHNYTQVGSEEPMLTDNQNFIFTASRCRKGIGDWSELYEQVCEDESANQIDTNNLICFAAEANGNELFYDLNTGQVLLFAPDHAFDNVEVLEGQPEYTFYTINEVEGFVEYVELLAEQWKEMLEIE